MRPPICAACDRDQRDHANLEFELVTFRDYESINHPGHPTGLEWFCQDHIKAATSLAHLSSHEAVKTIKESAKEG